MGLTGESLTGESQTGGGSTDTPGGATSFRVLHTDDATVDTEIYDLDPVSRSFNRFASGAIALLFDDNGTKKTEYPYYEPIDIQFSQDGGASFSSWLSGIVVDREQTDEEGAESLKLDVVSYDHLLRRDTVEKSYNDSITNILKDVVESFTPVTWNAARVTVLNDASVNRDFKGERPDEVMSFLASRSGDEEWGVTADLEFFFTPQSESSAPAVTDTDVVKHDFPERGKRTVNSVQVYYGANLDKYVTINDRTAQQELKDQIGAARRVIIRKTDSYSEVSTEAVAEAIAREQLGDRERILTGTLRIPIGRFDIDPGDVVSVTVSDADISSTDFRVAQIKHYWAEGETELTLAENIRGDIDDLLVELSDDVVNTRLRDVDLAATEVEHLDVESGVTLSVTGSVVTRSVASDAFVLGQSQLGDVLRGGVDSASSQSVEGVAVTRAFLNMMRDVWQGESFTDVTHVSVGTGDAEPTVADNTLDAEVTREPIGKYGASASTNSFEFVGRVPAGGVVADAGAIQEIGFADARSAGNHYLRGVVSDSDLDAVTSLRARFVVTINTDTVKQGVVTSTGQERWRDLVIGETSHEPSDFVYGSGSTAFSESSTALSNKQHEDAIDSREDSGVGETLLVERVTAGDADTNGFSEVGMENAADEFLGGVSFEGLNSDKVLQVNWLVVARNA